MADKYNGNYPKAWTDAQIDEYLESGREPDKASNGVWVTDVEREEKDLVDWTVAELFALYSGELDSTVDPGGDAFVAAIRVKARLKSADAGKWGNDELYEWLVSGKEPAKTPRGNFVNDPERFTKDVHLLNDSELLDFGLELFGPYSRDREYVLVEALERFGLPTGTTFEDYTQYCVDGSKPAVAEHGSLVHDRTRAGRLLSEWTEEEILDWIVGGIDSAGHDEKELLAAAIEQVGGEWYWSKVHVQSYLVTNTMPDSSDIETESMSMAQFLKFLRETKCDEQVKAYIAKVGREYMEPTDTFGPDVVPKAWSDDEIQAWALEETIPAFFENVWVNDVTREERSPLTFDETKAIFHGKITVSDAVKEESYANWQSALTDEAQELYVDDALAWFFDDDEPRRTETGEFYLSKLRDSKPVVEWTDADVRMLLSEQIITKLDYDVEEVIERKTAQWAGLGTIEQRTEWFVNETEPALTPNGVFIDDPRRKGLPIREWGDAELIALANQWIFPDTTVMAEAIIAVLFDRKLIKSDDWTLDEAAEFLNTGKEPEKTDFGNDVIGYDETALNRKSDLKFFSDWANGKVLLPNPEPQILNRVRALIGANSASDEELKGYLRGYKADGSDKFRELTLREQLDSGCPEVAQKVAYLWNLPVGSSIEECIAAYDNFEEGTLASTGVLMVDERRDVKAAKNWALEEIRAWARGEIPSSKATSPATLVTAVRSLISAIGTGWDDVSIRTFVATGEPPKTTSTGVLVVDIVRDKKYPTDWEDADLTAWAKGEIVTNVNPGDIKLTIRNRFKVPSKWTDAQMLTYVQTGEEPAPEPAQPFTNARSATDRQIEAWLRGEFEVSLALEAAAFLEARARFKLNVQWTDAAIRTYYKDGVTPAKTSNGLFVEDRLRDITSVAKWSFAEVVAFAKDEFKAPTIGKKGPAFLARARQLIQVEKGLPSGKWADVEVLTYLQTGECPVAVGGTVFTNDPSRASKQAIQWTDNELKAWLRGEIDETAMAPAQDLWERVYVKFNVPNAWYTSDARSYVLEGKVVPSTPSGIYVRDRERDLRPYYAWTRAEVKAWARGQILPGLNAQEADLVRHACTCFNIPSTLSPDFIKQRVASITEDTTPMTVGFVREDLLSFAAGMKKEGADEEKAALYHGLMLRCISRVCALKGQDFVDGWSELLKFYYDHRNTLFQWKNLYFGMGMMAVSAKQQKHYNQMTTVLYRTADPVTRDTVVRNGIDWVIALAGLPTDEARHQVMAYYGIG